MNPAAVRCVPLGDRAITVVLGDQVDAELNRRATRLAAALRDRPPPGMRDVVPAYATVSVWYDPRETGYDALEAELIGRAVGVDGRPAPTGGRRLVIPVCYQGPDLEEVATRTGLSPAEVIRRHAAPDYRVYLVGFVPGFAFLGELDPALVLPRRTSPRTRVPAGSVGIAGAQTAVYPLDTPGGWHLIGHTDLVMFDPVRDPPTLLGPGDLVRFEPVP